LLFVIWCTQGGSWQLAVERSRRYLGMPNGISQEALPPLWWMVAQG
jgi:hypothetical protein